MQRSRYFPVLPDDAESPFPSDSAKSDEIDFSYQHLG